MKYQEINQLLVKMVKDLAAKGYKKSTIGTCLLGSSSYAPILKMINAETESDYSNLGIKPLASIADTFNHGEVHLAFIDPNNDNGLTKLIYENNMKFFENAKQELIHGMDLSNKNQKERSSKAQEMYTNILDDLLSDDTIIGDE